MSESASALPSIVNVQEARAIVRLLETELYGVPAWVSFSCKDGLSTCHGERFAAECVPLLMGCPGVAAIGVNCTAPKHVRQLLEGTRDALGAAAGAVSGDRGGGGSGSSSEPPVLLCYPNSGEDWDCAARCWRSAADGGCEASGPAAYAAQAKEWVASGARLVGGCCRTTPQHIFELRRALLR